MERLVTVNNNSNLKNSLNRIEDIVYYEGPLLTLYENIENGQLYLVDWVDRDKTSNRWLVYRIHASNLLDFLKGKISHLELFERSKYNAKYVVNIPHNGRLNSSNFEEFLTIPDEYLPNPESYFDCRECPSLKRLQNYLIRKVSQSKFTNEVKTNTFRNSKYGIEIFSIKPYNILNHHIKRNIKNKGSVPLNAINELCFTSYNPFNGVKAYIVYSSEKENQKLNTLPPKYAQSG